MIQAYMINWLFEVSMLIMLITTTYRYMKMKPRTTRALIGLIAILILALPVSVAIAIDIARPNYTNFSAATGAFNVVILDLFTVVTIQQWTLVPMTTRAQRMGRRVVTGATVFMGVVTLALLVYLHF
jgi:hypothetical protein